MANTRKAKTLLDEQKKREIGHDLHMKNARRLSVSTNKKINSYIEKGRSRLCLLSPIKRKGVAATKNFFKITAQDIQCPTIQIEEPEKISVFKLSSAGWTNT